MAKQRTKNLPPETIQQLLEYDPLTGVFRWKAARGRQPKGAIAGSVTSNGYRYIGINGVFYLAHRVAWLFMKNEWPQFEIDHRNRKRDDNRWSNLREATVTQNKQNSSMRKDNTSGSTGVVFSRRRRVWVALIYRNGSRIFLGEFKDKEQAAAARRIGAAGFYGDFAP